MKDDIRKKTCLIIRKNGYYLVGHIMGTSMLRWSENTYEAWRTRDREKAEEVARMTGGVLVLFNPIVGKKKLLGA